jgi:flagellar basal body-associated protein FliL
MADRAQKACRSFSELSWAMQTSLAFQMVLAAGVVYLLLHHGGGILQDQRTIQSQPVSSDTRQIATLTTDLAAMAKDQQFLREQIASYEKSTARTAIEIEHRVERRLLPELQKATLEMVRVRQQVQELTTAKEAMKQDLAAVLKQQTETLARMKLPPTSDGPQSFRATTSPPLAQAEEPPKIAGGARPEEFKPLTFWVSFQEGTTEKHVQDLLHQFRGRKLTGPTPTGWINIEAQLKQSETIEGFFETLKKANIVRAITTSLTGQ